LVPYLRDLGITDLYLSPILEARAGSTHGYDVTDPWAIRAELGGEAGLDALTVAARTAGLGIVLDIVPNHMAASIENPWWRDLLEFGIDSPHTSVFDLSWRSDPGQLRLLLPFLGDDLAAVLDRGEIELAIDAVGFTLAYGGSAFPLTPASYAAILEALDLRGREPPRGFDAEPFSALDPAPLLDAHPDPYRRQRAVAARDAFLREIAGPGAAEPLKVALAAWNARPADERRPVVESVLERQPYELAFWRRALREISYRRFFDVSELVGIRVDDSAVLAATHRRILTLIAGRLVTGIRVDHVDGLRDPLDYLDSLSRAGGEAPPYILVEKILAPDETLPEGWRTAGTTGYEFIAHVDGWFIDPEGWRELRRAYTGFTSRAVSFEQAAYDHQRRIIEGLFGGEFRALVRDATALAPATGAPAAADAARIARALAETSACLGVYRTYIRSFDVQPRDRERIERAVREAAMRATDLPDDVIPWLARLLLLDVSEDVRGAALEFVIRWQQFTGPVMAKGYEDTALYNDFTLTAANEVGGRPGDPAVSTDELHTFLAGRARHSQHALSAASTHDTKRGEDARARIAVLSEVPSEWARFLDARIADTAGEDPATPSPADRVLLYQTLLATWPGRTADDDAYAERIAEYMTKAARESKARTSWRDQDPVYEAALAEATRAAVAPGPIRAAIEALAARIALPGALGSVARTLVRVTAPGVPDTYQGAELWHDALVDPDNRRPVDYDARHGALGALAPLLERPSAEGLATLHDAWMDGRIKLYVLARLLRRRALRRQLFQEGGYLPLTVEGTHADRVFAFAREHDRQWSVTLVTRWLAGGGDASAWTGPVWQGTTVRLPPGAPLDWVEALTGIAVGAPSGEIPLAAAFGVAPFAVLEAG
jgi:(1->4)-alpha-D-glucan 1-alpha-D-glucosylmutase